MLTTRIGAFTVARIEEMLTPGFDPAFLFPDFDAAIYAEEPLLASPAFHDTASGKTMSSMQSWLVRDDRNVIVIDTGCGNGKAREFPAFRRFHMPICPIWIARGSGVRPQDVTHVDQHAPASIVGWNTVRAEGRWILTFPNARYFFGAEELASWLDPATARARWTTPVIEDSVRPVSRPASSRPSRPAMHPAGPVVRGHPRPHARPAWRSPDVAGRERFVQRRRLPSADADRSAVLEQPVLRTPGHCPRHARACWRRMPTPAP